MYFREHMKTLDSGQFLIIKKVFSYEIEPYIVHL